LYLKIHNVRETSRLPHFLDNRHTDDGEVVSLTLRKAALYTHEDSWYSFLLGAESMSGPSAAGRIRLIEESMTSLVFESSTFRLVAQCLKQLHYRVSQSGGLKGLK
jgi:hypothetical protein